MTDSICLLSPRQFPPSTQGPLAGAAFVLDLSYSVNIYRLMSYESSTFHNVVRRLVCLSHATPNNTNTRTVMQGEVKVDKTAKRIKENQYTKFVRPGGRKNKT